MPTCHGWPQPASNILEACDPRGVLPRAASGWSWATGGGLAATANPSAGPIEGGSAGDER
jgi:hypothetical protein